MYIYEAKKLFIVVRETTMQTLKIKYLTDAQSSDMIREYRKQYSSVLHYAYNRRVEGMSEKDTEVLCQSLNNTPLIKSFHRRCAVKNASQLVKSQGDDKVRVIFGGKKNCVGRAKGLISKEEYRELRIGKLFFIGEANYHGNRTLRINEDIESFTFTPERGKSATLTIAGGYRRYKEMLRKLYKLQQSKAAPITYSLDGEYVYVTFDELLIEKPHSRRIVKNRVFAIDLNPNYVGWSVVDWLGSERFNVVASGIYSTKDINDADFALKEKKLPSTDPQRKYLTNKRNYETLEISKALVNKATHYHCELFAVEDLSMESNDKGKGKGTKCNKLVNNLWNRNKLVANLQKRCNCRGIKFYAVVANYSSFIGNVLYRPLGLPDMVLASIEIGRRGYEFHGQYVTKEKDIRKNIVIPEVSGFGDWYSKSLEEFGVSGEAMKPIELYNYLKETKCRYRLSLDLFTDRLKFSRCFSHKSKIIKININ